jgi:Ca-activated chloride channel family protein
MNELWDRLDPGFLDPIWLGVGFLAVVAVILLEIGAQRRRKQAVRLFAASHLVSILTGSVSSQKRLLKQILLTSAVGLLFLALARPHLFYRWDEESRSGLDILLAVDCSKSMDTEDVRPNRIERAKLAIEDFADHLPSNRLGLIAFAGDAFLECPLTLDHDAFQTAVRDLDTDTIPRPGTDIATAIDEAILALKSQPNNLKFLILVTDGEDLEGRVLDAAKRAAQTGMKIYTVGVGTPEGGLIPEHDDSGQVAYLHDSTGQIVQSKLDESTLRQIAQITGGAYEPLGPRGEGLENIYDRYIAPLPKQHLEERRQKIPFEQFEWPLGLAILFLIGEFMIRERASSRLPAPPPEEIRRRQAGRSRNRLPTPVSLVATGVLLGAGLTAACAASVDTAEQDYKSGQYGDAAEQYGKAAEIQPNRHDLDFDRGDAAYKAGQYTEAESAFRKALETPDLKLQEDSYYNLGNTQFKDGEAMEKVDPKETRQLWEHSLGSYESALKLKDAADTRHNYEVVKKKLEELKKQQQQQQNQQNQNSQQQPKDQGQSGQNPQSGQGKEQQQQPQNQQGQNNPQNNSSSPPRQQPGDQNQPQQQPGSSGDEKKSQDQPKPDTNASAQMRARSTNRDQDQQDPGVKSRQEAEALLDSLKDDEHHVTARSLLGNNEAPPPPPSGKDW